jgi:hypothetical protein
MISSNARRGECDLTMQSWWNNFRTVVQNDMKLSTVVDGGGSIGWATRSQGNHRKEERQPSCN